MHSSRKVFVALTAGAVAALAAAACCAGPRLAALLGCRIRWVARVFTELAPFHPGFVAVAAAAFGFAHFWLYASAALPDRAQSSTSGLRWQRVALWILATLSLALILFPLYAPVP